MAIQMLRFLDEEDWKEIKLISKRITKNRKIGFGKPIIKGTRVSVEAILDYLAAGNTIEEITKIIPFITKEDVVAAILYARWMLRGIDPIEVSKNSTG